MRLTTLGGRTLKRRVLKTEHRGRLAIVAVAAGILGVLFGLFGQGVFDAWLPEPCETRVATTVGTDALPGMVEMGSQALSSAGLFLDRDPEVAGTFRSGRSTGFVTSRALSSPYREQADEVARNLGYQVGQWPLVPLSGQIVSDTPGLLEAYITVQLYKTNDAARYLLARLAANGSGTDQPSKELTLRLDAPTYGYSTTMGPDDGQHERELGGSAVVGSAVVQIDLRGGTGIAPADLERLLGLQLARIKEGCHVA
jgi:hypothetical protein